MGEFCARATETLDDSDTMDKVAVWPLSSFLPSSIQKLLLARYVFELHSRTYIIVRRISSLFPLSCFLSADRRRAKGPSEVKIVL